MNRTDQWFQLDRFTDAGRGIPPVDIRYGPGRLRELGAYVAAGGWQRVMLVTGPNVSRNGAVMDPVTNALGPRIVGTFFETTPAKTVETIFDGIAVMRDCKPDLLVGIGGASSLVVARQMSALESDGRSIADVRDRVIGGDGLQLEVGASAAKVVAIPSTLAGGDLSAGGTFEVRGATASPDGHPSMANPLAVGPTAIFYDPEVLESTPPSLIAGSAINGLDKGIETLYSPRATVYSDAVAERGVTLMTRGILALGTDRTSGLQSLLSGLILVQLQRQVSVLHAFGHAFSRYSSIQQGVGHAVMAPHVLRLLLSLVQLRREVLGRALRAGGASEAADDGDAIVASLERLRDALGLPDRLSQIEGGRDLDLQRLAEHVCGDHLLDAAPLSRPLTVGQVRSVFEAAS